MPRRRFHFVKKPEGTTQHTYTAGYAENDSSPLSKMSKCVVDAPNNSRNPIALITGVVVVLKTRGMSCLVCLPKPFTRQFKL